MKCLRLLQPIGPTSIRSASGDRLPATAVSQNCPARNRNRMASHAAVWFEFFTGGVLKGALVRKCGAAQQFLMMVIVGKRNSYFAGKNDEGGTEQAERDHE